MNVLLRSGQRFIMEANKFESRAQAAYVTNVIREAKHDPMRQAKFVVSIESALQVSELLWPERKVDKLVIFALSTVFN